VTCLSTEKLRKHARQKKPQRIPCVRPDPKIIRVRVTVVGQSNRTRMYGVCYDAFFDVRSKK